MADSKVGRVYEMHLAAGDGAIESIYRVVIFKGFRGPKAIGRFLSTSRHWRNWMLDELLLVFQADRAEVETQVIKTADFTRRIRSSKGFHYLSKRLVLTRRTGLLKLLDDWEHHDHEGSFWPGPPLVFTKDSGGQVVSQFHKSQLVRED